jgi:predicted porin
MNKKLLTIAITGAMAAPMTAHAIKWKISGQINRAVSYMDDGQQSDIRSVDNSASNTRFRMRGSEDMGNGMKVGAYWELGINSSPSSKASPDADTENDGAGNGTTEVDLSGTDFLGTYASKNDLTARLKWRSSALGGTQLTNAAGTLLTEGATYNNFDAFSRYDNVRYDSPNLGPVILSASVGSDQVWEVAGRVKSALGGGQLSGAAFYGQATGANNVDGRWGGSVSYLFSQGINITGYYAQSNTNAGADSKAFGAKLGYKWGVNAISIGYAQAQDVAGDGFDDTGVNVGFAHTLKKVNTQLYAAFLYSKLDTPGGTPSAEDHTIVTLGARVKFD